MSIPCRYSLLQHTASCLAKQHWRTSYSSFLWNTTYCKVICCSLLWLFCSVQNKPVSFSLKTVSFYTFSLWVSSSGFLSLGEHEFYVHPKALPLSVRHRCLASVSVENQICRCVCALDSETPEMYIEFMLYKINIILCFSAWLHAQKRVWYHNC